MNDLNFKTENTEFGQYLRLVRQAKKISIRQLAKEVSKTPTYISDIENGNNKPPEIELLNKILAALQLADFPDVRNKLYDSAAKERKDVPADIKEYIIKNKSILKIIRIIKENPNEKKIWAKISQII
ncbi:MAG: helix-turn-helix transcriptional regulator [Phascolarctobacterium sp.]|uniref:helix-turn-helix domain-containing protein n=1 Tax=Phascolarctobacterium sp. TaxID=2049039 RepID=UPI0026DC60F4|nr:helix-turn-helix transcriptional regulator [Phascolarctobacterium sp.]MDO4920588.1 helix-turn-helix transcriptional regulator [Phascolarctobacterium sp.]